MIDEPTLGTTVFKWDRAEFMMAFENPPGVSGLPGAMEMKPHNVKRKTLAGGVRISPEPHLVI